MVSIVSEQLVNRNTSAANHDPAAGECIAA
jgi:hypothetical protein